MVRVRVRFMTWVKFGEMLGFGLCLRGWVGLGKGRVRLGKACA